MRLHVAHLGLTFVLASTSCLLADTCGNLVIELNDADKFSSDSQAIFDLAMSEYKAEDYESAIRAFAYLARANDADSQHQLGIMYSRGLGVEQNYEEALNCYTLSANQGNAKAQNSLGALFYDGRGVKQDYAQARKWFEASAAQGNPAAQVNLGLLYTEGNGAKKDLREAFKWFFAAAEQGHASGQLSVGYAYRYGDGVKRDLKESVKWFLMSALQNNVAAQYNLGIAYYHGHGVAQDMPEAAKWFRLAAEQGDQEAIEWLEKVEEALEISKGNKPSTTAQEKQGQVEKEDLEGESLSTEDFKQENAIKTKADEQLLAAEEAQQQESAAEGLFSYRQLAVLSLWSSWLERKEKETWGTRTAAKIEEQIIDLPFYVEDKWLDDVVKWQSGLSVKPFNLDRHLVVNWVCVSKRKQNEDDIQLSGSGFYRRLTCHTPQNLALNSNSFEYFMNANFELGFTSENNDFIQFRLLVPKRLEVPYPIFVNDVLRFSGFVGCDESAPGELGSDIQCFVGVTEIENMGEFSEEIVQTVVSDRNGARSAP